MRSQKFTSPQPDYPLKTTGRSFVEWLTKGYSEKQANIEKRTAFLLYFLAFPINHNTSATIKTTTITPTHIPALKIPPMAWQLDSRLTVKASTVTNKKFFLITLF
jgi:hypothetical protein